MLKLAELLCNAGVKITFLNTEEFHERLIRHRSDVFSRCINLPGFQFKTTTDGLPPNHPRISDKLHEYWSSLASVTPPLWRRCRLIPCHLWIVWLQMGLWALRLMLPEKLEFPFSIFVPSVLVLFGLTIASLKSSMPASCLLEVRVHTRFCLHSNLG